MMEGRCFFREVVFWRYKFSIISRNFLPPRDTEPGGMGPIAKAIYKKLAPMVATKHNQSYSQAISWLQCRFSFSLLCSSIMCQRGSCFSTGNPQFTEATIDRAICDDRVPSELDMNLLELIKFLFHYTVLPYFRVEC